MCLIGRKQIPANEVCNMGVRRYTRQIHDEWTPSECEVADHCNQVGDKNEGEIASMMANCMMKAWRGDGGFLLVFGLSLARSMLVSQILL